MALNLHAKQIKVVKYQVIFAKNNVESIHCFARAKEKWGCQPPSHPQTNKKKAPPMKKRRK